jgi:hypothetical protein
MFRALLCGLLFASIAFLSVVKAQQPRGIDPPPAQDNPVLGCIETDQLIPWEKGHIEEPRDLKRIAIVEIKVNSVTTITVKENQMPSGKDDFAPTVEILEANRQLDFPLTKYIKYGEHLYLRRLRTVCTDSDNGIVVLAFEAGSTNFLQGFLFMKFSLHDTQISAVPIVQQGRIEIDKSKPYEFDLWAADDRDQGCAACEKDYFLKHCKFVEPRSQCEKAKGPLISRDPNEVTGDLIRIRQVGGTRF